MRVTGGAVKAWVSAQAPTRGVARCAELELSLSAGKYLVSLWALLEMPSCTWALCLSGRRPAPALLPRPLCGTSPPGQDLVHVGEPIHDCAFTVEIEGGEDLTSELEAGPIDVPDYATYSSASAPTRIDGGISLETLERQCMLLFPTTFFPAVPGSPMVSYSAAFCRRAVAPSASRRRMCGRRSGFLPGR